MKKIALIITLFTALSILCSCAGAPLDIESYEWTLVSVTKSNPNGENAKEIQFDGATLVAKNGSITITDASSSESFSGTYLQTGASSKGRDYSVSIADYSGNGILSSSDYYSEETVPTISFSISNGESRYILVFKSKN